MADFQFSYNRTWSVERAELAKMYPGKNWEKKVLEMSDNQVHQTLIHIRNSKEKKNDR